MFWVSDSVPLLITVIKMLKPNKENTMLFISETEAARSRSTAAGLTTWGTWHLAVGST